MPKKKKLDLMQRVLSGGKKTSPAFLPLRVAPEVKAKLQSQADKAGVSLNLFLHDLIAAKADGNPNPVTLEDEHARSAEREVKQTLQTSVSSVRDVRARLDGLQKFWRALVSDVEDTLSAGRYSFWARRPDDETRKMLAALEKQIDACAASLSSTRDEMIKARPKTTSVLDRALGRE